ncbi:MAG TPA: hypothetical protein VGB73_04140 [Pyrinomonadaceae bacterium]|jgi:hypothetical protein
MFSLRQPRICLVLLLTVCMLGVCLPAHAQQQSRRPASSPAPRGDENRAAQRQTKRRRASGAQSRQAREAARRRQREQAVADLSEIAASARTLEDAYYSTQIQLLAADALWPADPAAARNLFRRAWEAAITADREEQEESERDTSAGAMGHVTTMRGAVLHKATRRDGQLAESFLRELMEGDKEYAEREASRASRGVSAWREPSAPMARRIVFARGLIQQGDGERAAALLAPALEEGVNTYLIDVLLQLRRHDAPRADALFLQLLRRTRSHLEETDANALLLLSSYVVSPTLFVAVDQSGAPMFRSLAQATTDPTPAPALSPSLRAAFYELAAAVLARRAAQVSADSSDRETPALYFALERLLPFFELDAPALAPALRTERDALAARLDAAQRDTLLKQRDVQTLAAKNPSDPLRSIVEAVAQEKDASRRERLRLHLVKEASRRRLWERARKLAAEIEDAEIRRLANTFIAVRQIENLSDAYEENDEDDYERAAAFVRNADAPPLARAWGFAQAAALAARRNKPERASELLDDAARFAATVENGSQRKVAAYTMLARTAARFDPPRAWELLASLVRAANACEDLSGIEANVEIIEPPPTPESGQLGLTLEADVFSFGEVFATMAHLDFERAREAARSLGGEEPRAFASIAVARAALERDEKKGASRTSAERASKPGS